MVFRNHNIETFMIIINVENINIFIFNKKKSGFRDEQNVQKNSIYLKYKSFAVSGG